MAAARASAAVALTAQGLIGGGMLVPLGPVFSSRVLDAGTAGFGLFIFALGCGVAVGVILLTVAIGWFNSREVINTPPLQVLRKEA